MFTFFAFIGWIACAIFLGIVSVSWPILAFNSLGKYNIGGVPNRASNRITTLLFGAIIGAFWFGLVSIAPFSITFISF